ncbi:glutamine amidotransferase [Rhodobacter sp. KR11]|uniref:glutamine amidotransferase n=1 Tax=Rhodobacter sp. KR11 TaxID=2974588 RepID=UPI002222D6CE|nr:glutamine amidotransferase [Rhodobacter sp. KR11]MCW1918324.1 glutamine amidotransferase [Rhodobacter sp. KR11]
MNEVIFQPLIGAPWIVALAVLAAALLALAVWRRLAAWALRALALGCLLVALCNPLLQDEARKPLSDIVILVVDDSASQDLSDRAFQTAQAIEAIKAQVGRLTNTELRIVTVPDGAQNAGTLAMEALSRAVAAEPQARLAGAILLTDGQVHDLQAVPALPAPLQVLLTGRQGDWDRRLQITNAPAFAIMGEDSVVKFRIDDQGAAPLAETVDVTIALDAEPPATFTVPLGQELELPIQLPHAGINVLQLSVAGVDGELTDRNNAAVVQINGVRDRLSVLLVSGEPNPGERVWRNLLKSDPQVDLVHFTILRPPEKQDGVPVSELSLIAFPTKELFVDKIKDFDLIIFDRYAMRGILPMSYLQNVVDYVNEGGTVLVAAGPEFGTVDSLWRSPLAQVLPVEPTSVMIEEGFRPAVTDLGRRHPVTEGLEALAPEGGWGRWFRLVEVNQIAGQALMSGPQGKPLLVLNRVGKGRVAVLASDQSWLWGKGFEGGGPQLELLRRLGHWMLKQPELEEEALTASVAGQTMTVSRRTVLDTVPLPVTVTLPDGTVTTLPLAEASPGVFQAVWPVPQLGLYRLAQGELSLVVAVGPSAPKEFEETIATADKLAPLVAATVGGVMRLEAGIPDIRLVNPGRPAAGRGWIGITPRGAYEAGEISVAPVLPSWLWLMLAGLAAVGAWLVEGRRRT